MTRHARLFSALSAAALACAAALPLASMAPIAGATPQAQPSTHADAQAKAIYDKAAANARALRSVECIAETTMTALPEGIPPAALALPGGIGGRSRVLVRFDDVDGGKADAAAARSPQLPPISLRVERLGDTGAAHSEGAGVVFTLCRGEVLRVDPAAKTFSEARSATSAIPLLMELMSSMASFPLVREIGICATMPDASFASRGTATIDGLECDLIEVSAELEIDVPLPPGSTPEGTSSPSKIRIRETLAIARVDGLPRQMRSNFEIKGIAADGLPGTATTLSSFKANPVLDDALFSVTPPAGFEKLEAKSPWLGVTADAAIAEGLAASEFPDPATLIQQISEATKTRLKVGDQAPDFSLANLDGKKVTMTSLKGKVVLLDFWATWCGPCVASMPRMQALHDAYAAKGVEVLGVSSWEQSPDAARQLMARKNYTYECLLQGDELALAYGIPGLPTMVVIGKDGGIALIETGIGADLDATLRAAIDSALGK